MENVALALLAVLLVLTHRSRTTHPIGGGEYPISSGVGICIS